jgi:hypothetical protein
MKRIIFAAVAVLIILSITACAEQPSSASQAPAESQPITQKSKEPQASIEPSIPPVNILLMGSSDKDFSDESSETFALTHIIITLDQNAKVLKFTTLPYNLAVDVDTGSGTETMQLLFVCMNYGDAAAVAAIEENFGIKIDYSVIMNMDGVTGVVDGLNGIDIDAEGQGARTYTGDETGEYFHDTVPQDESNYIEGEELIFRDHHEKIIKGVVMAVKLLGLNADGFVAIAESVQSDFVSDILQSDWPALAEAALACTENPPEFLHVPGVIKIGEDGCSILYDESDAAAVQDFIGQ